MKPLVIATRKSPLALWQANQVRSLLQRAHPGLEVTLLEMSTEGDRFLSAPLRQAGGKGLFIKEIEQAVIEGRANLAVHSLKDVTSQIAQGLILAAFPPREDPRDAWVSPQGLAFSSLGPGARVGTSSLRRACQLHERFSSLEIVSLRGNVQTRLRKVDELKLAGAVLAYAGLKRLGLLSSVQEIIPVDVALPAVGQGTLAIECKEDDAQVRALLQPLDDAPTRDAVTAERAFLETLEGGCGVPLAGYAMLQGDRLTLRGMVGTPDGKTVLRAEIGGARTDAAALGKSLAQELLGRGAKEILKQAPTLDVTP